MSVVLILIALLLNFLTDSGIKRGLSWKLLSSKKFFTYSFLRICGADLKFNNLNDNTANLEKAGMSKFSMRYLLISLKSNSLIII